MGSCWSYRWAEATGHEPLSTRPPPVVVRESTAIFSRAPVNKKWYHGRISDEQAESRLLDVYPRPVNGTYLVYDDPNQEGMIMGLRRLMPSCLVCDFCPNYEGCYILIVYNNGEVRRWNITRRKDGKYVLGVDCPGAIAHVSVQMLIKYHRGVSGQPLPITGGGVIKLSKNYVYVREI